MLLFFLREETNRGDVPASVPTQRQMYEPLFSPPPVLPQPGRLDSLRGKNGTRAASPRYGRAFSSGVLIILERQVSQSTPFEVYAVMSLPANQIQPPFLPSGASHHTSILGQSNQPLTFFRGLVSSCRRSYNKPTDTDRDISKTTKTKNRPMWSFSFAVHNTGASPLFSAKSNQINPILTPRQSRR